MIRGDTAVGSNRFFFVHLSNPTNAVLSRPQATAYLIEDDFHLVRVQGTNVLEGNAGSSNATIHFTLAPASSNVVTVDYVTLDGTASAGSDYLSRAGTLVFQPGATNLALRIPVLGDLCAEPDEVFFLQVYSSANSLLLTAEAAARIVNDDSTPALRILSLTPLANTWRVQFASRCDRTVSRDNETRSVSARDAQTPESHQTPHVLIFVIRLVAKSHFRNGGANLPVCRGAQQGAAHHFGNDFWQPV